MVDSGQQEIKTGDKGALKVLHALLAHISYRYHISLRLKIYINSLILAFPAFVQFMFFEDLEYLISFVLCFGLVASTFLITRARLIFTLPFVLISFIYTAFLVMYFKSLGVTSIMALFNSKTDVILGFLVTPKMITATFALIVVFALYIKFIILKKKDDGLSG